MIDENIEMSKAWANAEAIADLDKAQASFMEAYENGIRDSSYRYRDFDPPHAMVRTTVTLSESVSKTLKVYTVQTRNSMHAQSKVIEEALRDYFERRKVSIEQ